MSPGVGMAGAADLRGDGPPFARGPDPGTVRDGLEEALVFLLEHLGQPMSRAALRARVARAPGPWTVEQAVEALESLGLRCEPRALTGAEAEALHQPALALRRGGGALVITGPQADGGVRLWALGVPDGAFAPSDWAHQLDGPVLVVSAALRPSAGPAAVQRGRYGHWFWGPLGAARGLYAQVALAALLTNVFALAASVFSMIVYDRVMPNNATETLMALLAGVGLVLVGDFAIRTLRGYFIDVAGARADMVIADTLFEQLLEMEMVARRGSTGATAAVMKEFESLREFLTSATLATLIDLPFALGFLVVIALVGGPLVWVPLLAIPVVVLVSAAIQPQLRRLVQSAYEDGQSKHAVVVETLGGIETIKSLGAGSLMRRRWQDAIAHQSAVGLRTRMLSQLAGNTANTASQAVWIGTVAAGFFLIRDGSIGSGAIVACSMLAGRAIAPLAQLAQLGTRLNQALSSYKALNGLMSQPREHGPMAAYVRRDRVEGGIEFRDVSFSYPGQQQGGLDGVSFTIRPGERVALLGRVGSGKTTVARLLLGLYRPERGAVLVDGMDVRQFDPADLRSHVGAVLQDTWLASGTIKQNIALGASAPTDAQILGAAELAGVHDFVAAHPEGYGRVLRERGEGLSGGQRQAIAVARALVGRPAILLLDEPTSAMDTTSERRLIERLRGAFDASTVLVITHRATLLDLVDRVIVLDNGRVVADGPKSDVLRAQAPVRPSTQGSEQP